MSWTVMDANDMKRTLGRLAHEILEANQGGQNLAVAGILKRGYPVARRLAFLMTNVEGTTIPCAKLDIRPFRDDHPEVQENESEVPFEVTGKKVILVDEVIYTGRTIRAALDALMHYGRPQEVQLAVLVDRGHRELPIQPNFTGRLLQTQRDDHVTVKVSEYDGIDLVEVTAVAPNRS